MRESFKRVAETPTEELQHETARPSVGNLVYDMEDKIEAHLVNIWFASMTKSSRMSSRTAIARASG